jgi:hypothetical protein
MANSEKTPTTQTIFGNSELLLSTAAILGGAWAFAKPWNNPTHLIPLLTSLTLVLGGWYSFWAAMTRTNWAKTFSSWQGWEHEIRLPRWPYLQPKTPGAALHRTLGQVKAWWRDVGEFELNAPIRRAARSLLVSVLLGIVTGRTGLLLTLFFMTWTEITVLWHAGTGEVNAMWRSVALIGLPWLLGTTLNDALTGQAIISAFALIILVGLFSCPSPLSAAGPLLTAFFLIGQQRIIAAGWLVILSLPGLLLLQRRLSLKTYHHAVTPWLLGMLLLVAWSL